MRRTYRLTIGLTAFVIMMSGCTSPNDDRTIPFSPPSPENVVETGIYSIFHSASFRGTISKEETHQLCQTLGWTVMVPTAEDRVLCAGAGAQWRAEPLDREVFWLNASFSDLQRDVLPGRNMTDALEDVRRQTFGSFSPGAHVFAYANNATIINLTWRSVTAAQESK